MRSLAKHLADSRGNAMLFDCAMCYAVASLVLVGLVGVLVLLHPQDWLRPADHDRPWTSRRHGALRLRGRSGRHPALKGARGTICPVGETPSGHWWRSRRTSIHTRSIQGRFGEGQSLPPPSSGPHSADTARRRLSLITRTQLHLSP